MNLHEYVVTFFFGMTGGVGRMGIILCIIYDKARGTHGVVLNGPFLWLGLKLDKGEGK